MRSDEFNVEVKPLTFASLKEALQKHKESLQAPFEAHVHCVAPRFYLDKRRRYGWCLDCGTLLDKYPDRRRVDNAKKE